MFDARPFPMQLAVVPILVGPLQVLIALLPAILVALGSALLALFRPSTFKLVFRLLWGMKVTVLVTAAIVVAAVAGLRAALPAARRAVGKAEAAKHDWPIFRGDLRRTGAVPGTASPASGGVQWAFTEAKTFYSSPTIVGNRVYVTSAEFGVFVNKGTIYCFDADTGGVVWKASPDGYRASFSSPSISGKYLVVGEGLHQTTDARVFCLDVTRDGAVVWQFRTNAHVESSPAIDDGRVYFGAGDDGYYCFQLQPDAHGNPVQVWHLPHEKYIDAETSPIAHDGRIYFGLGEEGQAVCCVDAKTGSELWRLPTPAPVFTPPTVTHKKVLVGMGFANFVDAEDTVIERLLKEMKDQGKSDAEVDEARQRMPLNGEVWCIDLASHKVDWRFKTERSVLSAIAAGDDNVVCASRDGTVYAISYSGKERARWSAREPIIASPALTDRYVYVVTESGRLYALDGKTLQPAWESALADSGDFLGSPSVARGHVYIGSQNDGFLCVGKPADRSAEPIWAGPLGGPGKGGNIDGTPLHSHGTVLWQWPKLAGENAAPPKITAPAAALGNRIFVPIADGDRKGIACLEVDPKKPDAPIERWFVPVPNGVTTSPAGDSHGIFFIDRAQTWEGPQRPDGGRPNSDVPPNSTTGRGTEAPPTFARGGAARGFHLLNAQTGELSMTTPLSPDASGYFLADATGVLLQDQPRMLAQFPAFKDSPAPRWRVEVGELSSEPSLQGAIAVAATSSPPALRALDLHTGVTLWTAALGATPQTAPVIVQKSIYAGTSNGVVAHSLIDGRELWKAETGGVSAPLAITGSTIVCVNSSGELVLLNADNGQSLKKLAGALPGVPPLVTHDSVLYATLDGLMIFDLAEKTSRPWMDTSELGTITSPMILHDWCVYFATDKRGFIRAGKK
jgi:outer membrane protein assembly factor BamB